MFDECFTLNCIALVSKSKKKNWNNDSQSSRPEMFGEKFILKTLALNFTKMGLHHRCFPVFQVFLYLCQNFIHLNIARKVFICTTHFDNTRFFMKKKFARKLASKTPKP